MRKSFQGRLQSYKTRSVQLLNLYHSRFLQVPFVIVSLIDVDRQWFKSKVGISNSGSSRDVFFNVFTSLDKSTGVAVIPDDSRFERNPLVTGHMGLRFFAGASLIIDEVKVGSLCLINNQPRNNFSKKDEDLLIHFASMVSALMVESRQGLFESQMNGVDMHQKMLSALQEPLHMISTKIKYLQSHPTTDIEVLKSRVDDFQQHVLRLQGFLELSLTQVTIEEQVNENQKEGSPDKAFSDISRLNPQQHYYCLQDWVDSLQGLLNSYKASGFDHHLAPLSCIYPSNTLIADHIHQKCWTLTNYSQKLSHFPRQNQSKAKFSGFLLASSILLNHFAVSRVEASVHLQPSNSVNNDRVLKLPQSHQSGSFQVTYFLADTQNGGTQESFDQLKIVKAMLHELSGVVSVERAVPSEQSGPVLSYTLRIPILLYASQSSAVCSARSELIDSPKSNVGTLPPFAPKEEMQVVPDRKDDEERTICRRLDLHSHDTDLQASDKTTYQFSSDFQTVHVGDCGHLPLLVPAKDTSEDEHLPNVVRVKKSSSAPGSGSQMMVSDDAYYSSPSSSKPAPLISSLSQNSNWWGRVVQLNVEPAGMLLRQATNSLRNLLTSSAEPTATVEASTSQTTSMVDHISDENYGGLKYHHHNCRKVLPVDDGDGELAEAVSRNDLYAQE